MTDAVAFRVPPIVLNFLIECHCAARPGANIWPGGWDSYAGQETRAWLKAEGLIDENERTTERGDAWLERLVTTPPPSPRKPPG